MNWYCNKLIPIWLGKKRSLGVVDIARQNERCSSLWMGRWLRKERRVRGCWSTLLSGASWTTTTTTTTSKRTNKQKKKKKKQTTNKQTSKQARKQARTPNSKQQTNKAKQNQTKPNKTKQSQTKPRKQTHNNWFSTCCCFPKLMFRSPVIVVKQQHFDNERIVTRNQFSVGLLCKVLIGQSSKGAPCFAAFCWQASKKWAEQWSGMSGSTVQWNIMKL